MSLKRRTEDPTYRQRGTEKEETERGKGREGKGGPKGVREREDDRFVCKYSKDGKKQEQWIPSVTPETKV